MHRKLLFSIIIKNLQVNGTETLEATLKRVQINNSQTNFINLIKVAVRISELKATSHLIKLNFGWPKMPIADFISISYLYRILI